MDWRPSPSRVDHSSKRALSDAPETGLFAASAEEDPTILLHVLDRCSVNGHYWIDLAAPIVSSRSRCGTP